MKATVVLVITNIHCQTKWQLKSGACEKADFMFGMCAVCVLVDNV